jgi:hypothetical protein
MAKGEETKCLRNEDEVMVENIFGHFQAVSEQYAVFFSVSSPKTCEFISLNTQFLI